MSVVLFLASAAVIAGCSKESKQKEVATTVAQDTMLLHDLAEANKNTAAASANDNSLTTVRNSGEPTSGTVEEVSQNRPANTTVVPRPVQSGSQPTTSPRMTVPTTASDAPGRTTIPLDRSPAAEPASGDPCDSPTTTDQRSCLNRSIVNNDADLNRTYQELIAQSRKSGGPDLEERIRQSQRAWVNERDLGCRAESQSSGKLWARAVARCLANYSDRRTIELQRQLSGLRGQ